MMATYSTAVETARSYYNSEAADRFYANIWGGEYIHVGIYEQPDGSIAEASHRSIMKMTSLLNLDATTCLLDIGSGYGGTARYLVNTFGCQVDCLNLSEVHNQRHRQLNLERGLEHKIRVIDGNFEEMPFPDNQYDVVSSQDAILHSGNRTKVVEEVYRVLKPGGDFIFTDLMQTDHCPEGVLKPILERILLDSMASISFYQKTAEKIGFETVQIIELTEHLVTHYRRVLQEVDAHYDEIVRLSNKDYIDRMRVGLNHWIEGGQNGYLAWGILHFRKPKLNAD